MEGLREIGCRGFNVTMPYKVPILEFMDELTPAARIAGACNTVIIKDGRMTGHTTDGVGFMQSVTDAGHNIFRKKMTILGAGGAATAIITQAALDGVRRIDIFRRSRPEAFSATESFARKVQQETGCRVRVFDIADTRELRDSLEESAILVNATNVGMIPHEDGCPISDPSLLRPGLIVGDIFTIPEKPGCTGWQNPPAARFSTECICSFSREPLRSTADRAENADRTDPQKIFQPLTTRIRSILTIEEKRYQHEFHIFKPAAHPGADQRRIPLIRSTAPHQSRKRRRDRRRPKG